MSTKIINTHDLVLCGKNINLRDAKVDDAEFILNLRTDPIKSLYINQTENNLNKQIQYMRNYLSADDEWYFVVEDKFGNRLGTHSMHKQPILIDSWIGNNLGIGRWIMSSDANAIQVLESDYMIKKFAFEKLLLKTIPFMVHKNNSSVLMFHKKWGAKLVGYSEENNHYLFELTKEDYYLKINKIENILFS